MQGESRLAAGTDNQCHDHFIVELSLGGIDYHVIFISKGQYEKVQETERECKIERGMGGNQNKSLGCGCLKKKKRKKEKL